MGLPLLQQTLGQTSCRQHLASSRQTNTTTTATHGDDFDFDCAVGYDVKADPSSSKLATERTD